MKTYRPSAIVRKCNVGCWFFIKNSDYLKTIVDSDAAIAIIIEYGLNDLNVNFSLNQNTNETIGKMNNIIKAGNHKISKIAPTTAQ